MTAETVEKWLADLIGLDAHALGARAVADAVRRCMAADGFAGASDYLEHLRLMPEESLKLIEMIVVPETWFFRDREPFVFLARRLRETWLAAHPGERLRVLSVPCSSGEEPYSIAMTLQSAGLLPERYGIDAVDINPALLSKAAKGIYGPGSFKGGLPAAYERCFTLEGADRIVNSDFRAGIRFIRGNIMNLPECCAGSAYDVIFCRNLLIYQHAEARRKIIAALDGLLKPDGLLFVGHAEMMSLLTSRYEPVRHGGAFAYYKNGSLRKATEFSSAPLSSKINCVASGAAASAGQPLFTQNACPADLAGRSVPVTLNLSPASGRPAAFLDDIRILADQGRLAEASGMCESFLRDHPQSAEAHFILALIRAAGGQLPAAEECLRRALYLNADFDEALTYLALLEERRGDKAGAERLRGRAERVRAQSGATR